MREPNGDLVKKKKKSCCCWLGNWSWMRFVLCYQTGLCGKVYIGSSCCSSKKKKGQV